jgi:hypothetical protein
MKSFVGLYTKVFEALLQDLETSVPGNLQLARDAQRVSLLVKTRGIGVFTLDFPIIGKAFDKALSTGTFDVSGLPLCGTTKTKKTPRLFSGIFLRIFTPTGDLLVEPCTVCIRYLRQILNFAKKAKLDCSKERENEVYTSFYKTDNQLPEPDLTWSGIGEVDYARPPLALSNYTKRMFRGPHDLWNLGDRVYARYASTKWLHTIDRIARVCVRSMASFSPYDWKPKPGTGATSDSYRDKDRFDLSRWYEVLNGVFPVADFALPAYDHYDQMPEVINTPKDRPVSKLLTVPKTQKGPRLIACEPESFVYCQLLIKRYFDAQFEGVKLFRNSIRLRDASFNGRAALSASRTGAYATIDLSEASDRVTCRLVERLFWGNKDLLKALIVTRTGHYTQEYTRDIPKEGNLRKFTTMGSGCTFPVETYAFFVLALAGMALARNLEDISFRTLELLSRELWVYGDDLIVPVDCHDSVQYILEFFDFKVNKSKTHTTGFFRESCGTDAFQGIEISPAYVSVIPDRLKPTTIAATVAAHNDFYRRGFTATAAVLRSEVPKGYLQVEADSELPGLIVEEPRNDTRYDHTTQQVVHIAKLCDTATEEVEVSGHSRLLKFFLQEPHLSPYKGTRDRVLRSRYKTVRVPSRLVKGWN